VVVHRKAAPDDGKVEAIRFCLDSPRMNSAARRDFRLLREASESGQSTVVVPSP
jgi:hypothetical protein